VQRLREFGKWVVGAGAEATAPQRLASVCSEYKYWGTLVAEVDPAARPDVDAAFDITAAEQLLVRAFEETARATLTASAIKSRMVALDSSFDERNYGCRSFRDFLGRFPSRVRRAGRSGGDITLELVTTDDRRKEERDLRERLRVTINGAGHQLHVDQEFPREHAQRARQPGAVVSASGYPLAPSVACFGSDDVCIASARRSRRSQDRSAPDNGYQPGTGTAVSKGVTSCAPAGRSCLSCYQDKTSLRPDDERLSSRDRARSALWIGTALSKEGGHDYALRVTTAASQAFGELDEDAAVSGNGRDCRLPVKRYRVHAWSRSVRDGREGCDGARFRRFGDRHEQATPGADV
jgi:hypothetical protein